MKLPPPFDPAEADEALEIAAFYAAALARELTAALAEQHTVAVPRLLSLLTDVEGTVIETEHGRWLLAPGDTKAIRRLAGMFHPGFRAVTAGSC